MKKLSLLALSLLLTPIFVGCSNGGKHEHKYVLQNTTDTYKAENANCEHGNIYYYSCVCGQKGNETFEYGDPVHSLSFHDEVKATCGNRGNVSYWQCVICNRYFTSSRGTTELSEDEVFYIGQHDFHLEGIDENSYFPNFRLSQACSLCGAKEYTEVDGYDLTAYDFGLQVTKLKTYNFANRTDEHPSVTVDTVEKGLCINLRDYRDHELFVVDLPAIDYTKYDTIDYGLTVYNTENRATGDAGCIRFSINDENPSDMVAAGIMIYPTLNLRFSNDGEGNITASLSGTADGSVQTRTLSEEYATGKAQYQLEIVVWDGYRNVVINNPIVKEKYSYTSDDDHGARVSIGNAVIKPTVDTDTFYPIGENKVRFDLTGKKAEEQEEFTVTLPRINLSSYSICTLPIYMENGDCGEGNTLLFSFDGENYFSTDRISKQSTSYLCFVRNTFGYDVSFMSEGQVQGTLELKTADNRDIILGNESLILSAKTNKDGRIFSFGVPNEEKISKTYQYQYSFYDSNIQIGNNSYEPVLDTLSGSNYLKYDLSEKNADVFEYVTLFLPKIDLSEFEELYFPILFANEVDDHETSNCGVQVSFDGDYYCYTHNDANQKNYFRIHKNGSNYEISYVLNGVEDTRSIHSFNATTILSGQESLKVYIATELPNTLFRIGEPVISIHS